MINTDNCVYECLCFRDTFFSNALALSAYMPETKLIPYVDTCVPLTFLTQYSKQTLGSNIDFMTLHRWSLKA
jgi:hypothetical protein